MKKLSYVLCSLENYKKYELGDYFRIVKKRQFVLISAA